MSVINRLTSVVEEFHGQASVDTVYGEPIEANGRMVIPVAKIVYGFGAGYGSRLQADTNDRDEGPEENEGSGFGGGMLAKPVGVVEITESGPTFVRPSETKRYIPIIIICFVIGYLLGKRR